MDEMVRKLDNKVAAVGFVLSFVGPAAVLYAYYLGNRAGNIALSTASDDSAHLPAESTEDADDSPTSHGDE